MPLLILSFCQYGDFVIALLITFCRFAMGGLLAQMFMRSTKFSATIKLSAEHETPPIANVLLAVRFYFHSLLPNIF